LRHILLTGDVGKCATLKLYIDESHFQNADARTIASATLRAYEANAPIDSISIAQALTENGQVAARDALFDLMPTPEQEPEFHDCLHTVRYWKLAAPAFEFSTDDALDERLSEITWLWPVYIPRGFVTLLVGDQDQGKSTVAQDFCRTLLQSGRWPDGTVCDDQPSKDQPSKLLWIDTEGALALFRQRLNAWKMARGCFIFPSDPLQELRVDNAADWAWIEAAIEKFKPPLVVLDSLSGGHSGEENSNGEMKAVLKRLAEIAQRHQIAVIVVHHLAKAPAGVPDYPITLNRIRGASSITQFCRSVLALTAPDKNQPELRRLDVIKLNLAKKPPAVGYTLTDSGPAWGNAPEPAQPRRVSDDAIDWLRGAMSGGLRPSDEVWAEAQLAGIGRNAFHAAKKALGVQSNREGGRDGKWFLILEAEEPEH
jgi:hypothetical protein